MVVNTAAMTAGVVILIGVFYDLFQSVVLPRPAVRKVQLARLIVRPMWKLWRWFGLRSSPLDRSESRLAAFGPIALLALFGIWGFGLVLGYGLIIYGVRDQFRPELQDFPTASYVSASTLVPLAYGDFVPERGVARGLISAPADRVNRITYSESDHSKQLDASLTNRAVESLSGTLGGRGFHVNLSARVKVARARPAGEGPWREGPISLPHPPLARIR